MRKLFGSLYLSLLLVLPGLAQQDNLTIRSSDAIDTFISLFDETPLVALGETHEHLQLYDFLTALVQTEGFYTRVNAILIESGNARYQSLLDAYIAGKDVQLRALQKVWLNTTQSPVDPWGNEVYYNFLKTIRDLNQQIAAPHRIRVIAADPPIDWKLVESLEHYNEARGNRNKFYAQVAIDEVLKKGHKALMISGGAHFGYQSPAKTLVNQRIEKVYPNTVTVVLATSGLGAANNMHEEKLRGEPLPSITKLADSWIGQLPGPRRVLRPSPAPADSASTAAPTVVHSSGGPPARKKQDFADYLLYFGPLKTITYGKTDASIYESDDMWKEMNRRSKIRFNSDLLPETRKTGSLRPVRYN
jgi:uncharacterized iron-regulated protein